MIVAIRSQHFADRINGTVCSFVREFLANLTAPFAVSLFELIVLLSPLMIFFIVRYVLKGDLKAKNRFFKSLSYLSLIPTLFFLTVGIAAQTSPVANAGDSIPSYDELVLCSKKLISEVNLQSDKNNRAFSCKELSEALENSYSKLSKELAIEMKRFPKPKMLSASWLVNRLGILGHYSFLTGEVNIDPDIPSYMIPFTLAHEYAHFLGISNEAEANFLAFLACIKSDEPYIRYSGNLSVLEYFLTDVYKNDAQGYARLYYELSEVAVKDLRASYEYTLTYSGGYIYQAADEINSSYTEVFDKNGKFSYSAVSRYVTQYLLYS
jgi:hypothetical protein